MKEPLREKVNVVIRNLIKKLNFRPNFSQYGGLKKQIFASCDAHRFMKRTSGSRTVATKVAYHNWRRSKIVEHPPPHLSKARRPHIARLRPISANSFRVRLFGVHKNTFPPTPSLRAENDSRLSASHSFFCFDNISCHPSFAASTHRPQLASSLFHGLQSTSQQNPTLATIPSVLVLFSRFASSRLRNGTFPRCSHIQPNYV